MRILADTIFVLGCGLSIAMALGFIYFGVSDYMDRRRYRKARAAKDAHECCAQADLPPKINDTENK